MTNLLICQELPEPRRVESLWNLGIGEESSPVPHWDMRSGALPLA